MATRNAQENPKETAIPIHPELTKYRVVFEIKSTACDVCGESKKVARYIGRGLGEREEPDRVKDIVYVPCPNCCAGLLEKSNDETSHNQLPLSPELEEVKRRQETIYKLCCEACPAIEIDNSAPDSGVSQAINYWKDKYYELANQTKQQ